MIDFDRRTLRAGFPAFYGRVLLFSPRVLPRGCFVFQGEYHPGASDA